LIKQEERKNWSVPETGKPLARRGQKAADLSTLEMSELPKEY